MNSVLYNQVDAEVKTGLTFILKHFTAFAFPRTISTKTTQGKQILVNNRAEAFARFKQASYLDCRINAYSKHDIIGDPNFIFIDIDSTEISTIDIILEDRFQAIGGKPTVLFTGSGFHIYQPINSIRLDKLEDFTDCEDPSRQFLIFAERYLSGKRSDPNHYPSFKSCMVRIPGSINSKNNLQVKLVQSWNGQRPHIRSMIGSFYAYMRTIEVKQEEIRKLYQNSNDGVGVRIGLKCKWIEDNLLQTSLNDYRKTITRLILAPYLVNIRKLSLLEASRIIEKWLDLCKTARELNFTPKQFVRTALTDVKKSGYKPMSLSTLKQKNSMVYQMLGMKL